MAQARVAVKEGAEQQPSHAAIDNGNPANLKPKYLVLDDINIDLITVGVTTCTLISIFAFHFPTVIYSCPALITGASSGIGAELSYIFAERGHDLILVGRNEDQLDAVKSNVEKKYRKTAYTIASDLSLPGAAM
ncbi:hypothetical protein W97_05349 [Coniosporium apollinis CBS 100218]|uniref:Uncharacterized protein n=1 Tax=Coniosporium apollinis (strain CBS 100218) TaxID=1168221 RepID=R7YWU4_CONA1|nr:uncharacterized protein W97_05349 [Coniosporium apollinis CBS 100218]EON66106.1 hypothetical protein W97_05349 [Coniosporium apollinis CBS 100218]